MEASVPKAAPKSIRVRFAPSPTGPIHIGGVRTALFSWLYARKHEGKFVLRIEDTDKERSEKKYEAEILQGLSWLGIDWDEGPQPIGEGGQLPLDGEKGEYGPYRQSERTDIYKKYLKQLMDAGEAYYCYCSKEDIEAQRQAMLAQGLPPKYSGHCRNLAEAPEGKSPEVIRFKTPEVKVEFKDLVRGKVTFDAALFGDFIIAKDLDSPLYNFAVVVDDALMEISHVIRGEEHLSNTPKQILMSRALGFDEPLYAHIPLILNPDRSKMSKRFADTSLMSYRERGYVPEAIVNFLGLMGWHPKGDKEVMSRDEMVAEFELERVQQAGAIFNEEKLDWLNREHMKAMPVAEVAALAAPFFEKRGIAAPDEALLERAVIVQIGRAKTLDDLAEACAFFFALPEYEPQLLVWKDKSTLKEVAEVLTHVRAVLDAVAPEDFTRELLTALLPTMIGERSRGIVLWPLRVALSGQAASPDPIEIMEVIGKEESLKRIDAALKKAGA
ncbi:MAG TPA: glutamate--tRNA ligase [Candidatus Paceibacterota bacterium]|nr:glutamate--tRNA ligase [Candidatus Paceibacterota bacterium]